MKSREAEGDTVRSPEFFAGKLHSRRPPRELLLGEMDDQHPANIMNLRDETQPLTGLLDSRQVANLLGMKESTIRKWRYQGLIPQIKLGRAARFNIRALSPWVKNLVKP
jgi:excisionase family DNA binding protein